MKPINTDDLRKIDLNLALVFHVIYEEASVTSAARRLYLTQPAISASLARLRELCGDALFVRQGRNLRATPFADQLAQTLRPALAQLQAGFTERETFDPRVAQGVFRVGMLDDLEISLLPLLARDLRTRAPGIRLSVRSADFHSLTSQLEREELDVALGVFDHVPKLAVRQEILCTSFRTLYDPRVLKLRHPFTMARFLELEHVLVSFRGDFHGLFEEKFDPKEYKRNIVINTPRFSSIPYLLQGSRMICTMPEYLAYRFARSFGLATIAAPFVAESFSLEMVWPGYLDGEPDQQWLRSRLRKLVRMRDLAGG
jgi:LysR family transcriptional regulator, mexEF-oprN operon transcriptional activator